VLLEHLACSGTTTTRRLYASDSNGASSSVFVSKHNQSIHISEHDIVDYCASHGIIQHRHDGRDKDYRTSSTHVTIKNCPECENIQDNPTNQYKLYISTSTGAYFCHRCGWKGSWFDFKKHHLQQKVVMPLPSSSSSARSPLASSRYGGSSSSGSDGPRKTKSGGSGPPTPPLPLPPARLQALYSTALLDATTSTKESPNRALDYLVQTRGLTVATLRKYGVGRATYTFADANNAWVQADCVTFPWIISVADAETQELLRGSKFVWDGQAKAEKDLEEQQRLYRESSYVSSAPASSSHSIAVDGDGDEPVSALTIPASAMTPPPTLQELKEETYITRRIKVRSVERKDWQRMDPPGGGWGLFGFHTLPEDCQEIILTEGEYDAMAVWQATQRPAVSLPNGCRSLPLEVLPLLEEFSKIYLWMDNDIAGQEGAEQFAKKLGLQRCYIVKPTFGNCRKLPSALGSTDDTITQLPKDANDALRMGLDLPRILADAQLLRHERIIRFSDLRDEVLHEIMHPDQYVGHAIQSLPGFTSIIKGFRRGEVTVLTGPTGSGKTTFLGQLSVDLVEQGVNVLWGSFEIKNIRLIHKLMQQFAREPLPSGDPTMREKLEALSDRFGQLPFTFLKFHGGTEVEDVLDAMDYAVYVNDVELIILDNMQFMVSLNSLKGKGSSSFDKFDVQDMAIEKFRKFATDRNVHIVLVVHPKKEAENSSLSISSIYGTAKATQEADTVLILQNDGRRKFIEVKKNRFNGTLGHSPLHFDRQSCRYTETPVVNTGKPDQEPLSFGQKKWTGNGSNKNSSDASKTEAPVLDWFKAFTGDTS
jgi:twinkle protein